MFQSSEPYRLPPRSLAASVAAHAAAIVVLCVAGFHSSPLRRRVLHEILLAPPPQRPIRAARPLDPPPPIRRLVAPVLKPDLAPKLVAPVELPAAPPPALALEPPPVPLPATTPAPEIGPPPVKLGTFQTPDSKTAVEPVSRARPQLAGFSSAETSASAPVRRDATATGGFGAASVSPGSARHGVLSNTAGFGDTQTIAYGPSRVGIAHADFGDTSVASPARHTAAASSAALSAVEILDKPRPAYTEEARRMKIQGEVLLEVAFESTGRIQVLRVIHGLGHGLDEAAAAAASQIRFRPALQEGQPVDSSAVVHILFQLAD